MSYLFFCVSLRRRWARMLASLTLPVLLVALGPVQAEPQKLRIGTGDWVPDLELHRLPQVSHWVQQEAPERVNAILADWLERRGG